MESTTVLQTFQSEPESNVNKLFRHREGIKASEMLDGNHNIINSDVKQTQTCQPNLLRFM